MYLKAVIVPFLNHLFSRLNTPNKQAWGKRSRYLYYCWVSKNHADTPFQQPPCSFASQDLILNTRQNGIDINSGERKRQNRTGRLRKRSVCDYIGVAYVPFLSFLLLKVSWSGERIPRYACKRSQGCSRKRKQQRKGYSATVSTAAGT